MAHDGGVDASILINPVRAHYIRWITTALYINKQCSCFLLISQIILSIFYKNVIALEDLSGAAFPTTRPRTPTASCDKKDLLNQGNSPNLA